VVNVKREFQIEISDRDREEERKEKGETAIHHKGHQDTKFTKNGKGFFAQNRKGKKEQ
jgi:hypothetical protein